MNLNRQFSGNVICIKCRKKINIYSDHINVTVSENGEVFCENCYKNIQKK